MEEKIIEVFDNGYYKTKEVIKGTDKELYTTYNLENHPICLKILCNGSPIYLNEAIQLLGLKKEMVKQIKRIGYSGNSVDFFANILNSFIPLIESGYYMDKHCRFYKWSYKDFCLKLDIRDDKSARGPLLTEYEHKGKTVIRTDYNGSCL